jgi:hypothetical protein
MDGSWVDVEGPGDFADGPAFLDQREGEGLLIRAKLLWPAERHAAAFDGLASLVGSTADEGAFEFSDTGEHRQHHAPGRRGRIRPRLLKRL